MTEREDYSGAFDPGFDYEDLSKEALVRLVREYGLDRAPARPVDVRRHRPAIRRRGREGRHAARPGTRRGVSIFDPAPGAAEQP